MPEVILFNVESELVVDAQSIQNILCFTITMGLVMVELSILSYFARNEGKTKPVNKNY